MPEWYEPDAEETEPKPERPSREDGARQDKREAYERDRGQEWDAMTLDRKLWWLSNAVDSCISERLQPDEHRRLEDACKRLDDMSADAFRRMRATGETA